MLLENNTLMGKNSSSSILLALFNSTDDAILVLSDQRQLVGFNPAAQTMFDLDESMIGADIAGLPFPSPLASFASSSLAKGELTTEHGRIFDMEAIAVKTDREADGHQGKMVLLRDLTPFRELQRNQNEFIHIISHDLRSPLTTIRGYVNMLQEGAAGELTPQQSVFLDRIMMGIVQLGNLVDNIQDAGRFDTQTGFYEMSRMPVDLREIVQRVVGNLLIPPDKRNQIITVDIADDVPIINGDENMLERAIVNLVDNAVKYTPDYGSIAITGHHRGDRIEIAVRDSGIGIRPEDQARLFQKHSRIVRQETKKIKGTGLGLFIVKNVALHHNGSVRVESEGDQGSTFIMSIPLEGDNLVIDT